MANSILLVSDDVHECQMEKRLLQKQGYLVKEVPFQAKLPTWANKGVYDLFVVNVPRSRTRDETVFDWVRPSSPVPVIVLSPEMRSNYQVEILDAGADDVLTKPYRPEELLARVRAVLRRGSKKPETVQDSRIEIGELKIDLGARRVFLGEKDIRLTRTEFALFSALAERIDNVCSHSELLAKVWGWEYWDATQYLHVYFGRIRRKLGKKYGVLLETVTGMGYMLHSSLPKLH